MKSANLRRSKLAWLLLGLCVLTIYPAFVLAYTWSHAMDSPLNGGRHGPRDAYRHTLASAVVAYTLDARVISLVNRVMERRGKPSNRKDVHNNLVGASIGARAMRFSDIEPEVARRVGAGAVDATSPDQTTWLPEPQWQEGSLW